jgi:phosphatidylinositol alpha-1,6-mannosyltransferase
VSEDEKALILAAADIHVMPSVQVGPMIEGFGIVFLEAAAAGIPSIAGNTGGQPEAVLQGETGFVIDGTDLEQIKSAIRCLARDKELRLRMGRAGRCWAKKNDWDRIVERTIFAVR